MYFDEVVVVDLLMVKQDFVLNQFSSDYDDDDQNVNFLKMFLTDCGERSILTFSPLIIMIIVRIEHRLNTNYYFY